MAIGIVVALPCRHCPPWGLLATGVTVQMKNVEAAEREGGDQRRGREEASAGIER